MALVMVGGQKRKRCEDDIGARLWISYAPKKIASEHYFGALVALSRKGVNEKWKLQGRADMPFAKDAVSEQAIELFKPTKSD